MTIQADIRISINSGAALVLFILAFFGLLGLVAASTAIASAFIPAAGVLLAAFGGYLKKRDSNNRVALEAQKVELGCDPGKGLAQG